MRTTLDIEEDVLFAAKDLARREKKTAGQVISELALKHDGRLVTFDSGIALLAVKGATAKRLVTLV